MPIAATGMYNIFKEFSIHSRIEKGVAMGAKLSSADAQFLIRRKSKMYKVGPCIALLVVIAIIFCGAKIYIAAAARVIDEQIAALKYLKTPTQEAAEYKESTAENLEVSKNLMVSLYWHKVYLLYVLFLAMLFHHILSQAEDNRFLRIVDTILTFPERTQ
ncbi:hypothetical protein ACFL1E_01970 [Candidatus Omnitrophota bacterium]